MSKACRRFVVPCKSALKGWQRGTTKVWHAALLRKLEAIGVQWPLLQCCESYLHNRKQCVVIEGQYSD